MRLLIEINNDLLLFVTTLAFAFAVVSYISSL